MRGLFLILCIVGVQCLLTGQESFSLEQCIEKAEKHSPQANLVPIIQSATDLHLSLLQKNYLPQATLNTQSTWQSATTQLPFSIPIPGFDVAPPSKLQYKTVVEMTQTIWDGGVTKEQKKITRASAFAETQKVKMDLYSLREQVSILFFGSILSDKQVENASILQKDLEAKLVRTKNLKDGGLAIGNNLLVLEARLLELEQQINDAQTRKKAALEALSILTGEENMRQANLIWNETSPIPDITTINRPELDYFQAQSSWIDASEGLIKAKNMPKIGAFASAGVGRPALNFLSNRLEPYFIGGVQIRIPLTHFYSQANRIEKQELLINKEKLAVQEKNFLWLTKVKAASQEAEIKRFDKLLENDKKLIDIRMKIVKTAEVQLENGIITPNDYLTEANSLDLARQNLALHEIQRQQAIAALIITLGTKN